MRPARLGYITPDQACLLMQAVRQFGMSGEELTALLATSSAATRPEDMTADEFDDVMDRFVGWGFRHPAVPILSAAQLACLDEGRRRAGLDTRAFVALMRRSLGIRGRRHLDGVNFLVLLHALNGEGAGLPLPHAGFMTGKHVGVLHRLMHQAHVEPNAFIGMLMELGGIDRTGFLDRRGFLRVLARLEFAHKAMLPAPAPRMSGEPGMATQAQANLIWSLWTRYGGNEGDTSEAALDQMIEASMGLPGGLATLTRAGARAVLDLFLPFAAAARDGKDPLAAMQDAGMLQD